MAEANEVRVNRILKAVENWRMGSRPMRREIFEASIDLLGERLAELKDETEGLEDDEG